tara:strand:+ start:7261 stop:7491 length:231 start_codon:yes stop_codon:yes gene_type:complete
MAYSNLSDLRAARNQALNDSDFWMLPDSPLQLKFQHNAPLATTTIADYRQELRDITSGVTDSNVESVELPTLVLPD